MDPPTQNTQPTTLRKVIVVASIAAGIQFGWALQLSLLMPYIKLLGVTHKSAPLVWLGGPISGVFVQPIVGYYSDRCTSCFGRRRPFIFAGTIAVVVAVLLIGYAVDIGHAFGDDLSKKTRPRAIAIFVVGFWVLDVGNNMLQGPCRAFLGDLSTGQTSSFRTGYTLYSFFMGLGNLLGFAAGAYGRLHNIVPFTKTKACDALCANLKTSFFITIILLLLVVIFALVYVRDPPIGPVQETDHNVSNQWFAGLIGAIKELKKPIWMLMLVTAINWIAWFPFVIYDTDWMVREVYGGDAGTAAYDAGVHAATLGLMLNSMVVALTSLVVERVSHGVGGPNKLWGMVNCILAVCLTMTVLIAKVAEHERQVSSGATVGNPSTGVKASAMILFSVLGIPLAITYSIPFALGSIYSTSTGGGQVHNIAMVIPQIIIWGLSGPCDALFGGGNLPAFMVGAIMAVVSAILAIVLLPSPAPADHTANA